MRGAVETVVKLGGGALADPGHWRAMLAALSSASGILIVPGGGPFADAVRQLDSALGASEDASHWMAILGMDQHAHLIADVVPGVRVVHDPAQIAVEIDRARIPVMAPYRWLRAADPLPHSWRVTSDSIAAWIAAQVGAAKVVLIKPPGISGPESTDAAFSDTLLSTITPYVVAADDADGLRRALSA